MMRETTIAVRAAREAGKILMRHFGRKLSIKMKRPSEFVTQADMESNERIISILRKEFPDYGILSEESPEIKPKGFREGIDNMAGGGCASSMQRRHETSLHLKRTGRDADSPRGRGPWTRWVIDPLDGTHNFAYNLPLFGVSIALERGGKIVLGVINLPYEKKMLVAERGKGSFLNGKRIRVSRRGIKEAMVLFGGDVFNPDKMEDARLMGRLSKGTFETRMLGSAVIEHECVATGKMEAYIQIRNKPWDNAAGFLIVEEAGGKVSDFSGRNWDVNTIQFVASNGRVHEEILKIINKATF